MTTLEKAETPVELKVFEATLRIHVRSPRKEDVEAALGMHSTQVLPGATVTVTESPEVLPADARFVAMNGQFGREPLMVQKRSELKKLSAPNGELAIVVEENNTPYVARHDVAAGTAGLDISKTLSSEHGWTWIELRYFQALQQAAVRAQQEAMQRQQQARPPMGVGARPPTGMGMRPPKIVR